MSERKLGPIRPLRTTVAVVAASATAAACGIVPNAEPNVKLGVCEENVVVASNYQFYDNEAVIAAPIVDSRGAEVATQRSESGQLQRWLSVDDDKNVQWYDLDGKPVPPPTDCTPVTGGEIEFGKNAGFGMEESFHGPDEVPDLVKKLGAQAAAAPDIRS